MEQKAEQHEARDSSFQKKALPEKQPEARTKKSPEDLRQQMRDAGFKDGTSPGKGVGFVGRERPANGK
jgi:hypothetical protein